MHFGYSAGKCIIDNTNLARLRGTGKDAVICPEMARFAARYHFEFICHEKGHSDRKAGNERAFYTVETNFFPGRFISPAPSTSLLKKGESTKRIGFLIGPLTSFQETIRATIQNGMVFWVILKVILFEHF